MVDRDRERQAQARSGAAENDASAPAAQHRLERPLRDPGVLTDSPPG